MMAFTNDEMNLMCIYNAGTRTGLIEELKMMSQYLGNDEIELLILTVSTINKLNGISDEDFKTLDLIPDFEI